VVHDPPAPPPPAPEGAAQGDAWARLRRAVLEVAVRHDLDVRPGPAGVALPGTADVRLPWGTLIAIVDAAAPAGDGSGIVHRVHAALVLAGWMAGARPGDVQALACALPPGHVLHPGPAWLRERVPGGLAELGVALRTRPDGPVLPLPPDLADAGGRLAAAVEALVPDWPALVAALEVAGAVAAERLHPGTATGVVRPVNGHDALTLLASPAVRAAVAAHDGTGLRAVAVPSRRRAWFDDRHLDPAFVAALWALTPEPERGLPAAALVTRDEVAPARPGSRAS
jgi:hypothetical protein